MFLLSRQHAISGGCMWSHFSVCNVFTASYICAGSEQLKSFPLTFKQRFVWRIIANVALFNSMAWLVRFTSRGTIPLSPLTGKLKFEAETGSKKHGCSSRLFISDHKKTASSGEIANRMHPSPVNSFNGNLGFSNVFKEALTCRSDGQRIQPAATTPAPEPQPPHAGKPKPHRDGANEPVADMTQMADVTWNWCVSLVFGPDQPAVAHIS